MARMTPRSKSSRTRPLGRRSGPMSRTRLPRRRPSSSSPRSRGGGAARRRSEAGAPPTSPTCRRRRRPRRTEQPAEPDDGRPRRSSRRWSTRRSPTPVPRPKSGTRSPTSRPKCSTSRPSSRTPPTEADAPADDELRAAASRVDPRIEATPAEEDEPADEFDEFFSEQRLSDELNQALEAPLPDEPGAPATEEARGLRRRRRDRGGGRRVRGHRARARRRGRGAASRRPPPTPQHEDVLEDTPEFLEDAPEDDDLWFEQKPPKDFDFDD